MSKKDKPVLIFYGALTKTKYEIYPESYNYKYKATPITESVSGQIERFGVALRSLIYGIAYHIGNF